MNIQLSKKKSKEAKVKLITRIFVLILAALMVLGSCYYVIYFTVIGAKAAAVPSDEQIVRVGMVYGEDVPVGYTVKTETGFELGTITSVSDHTALWQCDLKKLTLACDGNLTVKGTEVSKSEGSGTDIGGYHLQLPLPEKTELASAMAQYSKLFALDGLTVFPACVHENTYLRVGAFASLGEANAVFDQYKNFITGLTVVSPSQTGVTAFDPETNTIVFEFDSSDPEAGLAVTAIQPEKGESLIVDPKGYSFGGIFRFSRHTEKIDNKTIDGIMLVNIINIEQYIEGVLPYEISSGWSNEAMKAFSVAVRSYAITMLGRHKKQGFDLCNTVDCEVYLGRNRTTQRVCDCVAATKGQVLISGGKICQTFYSASMGGCTVGVGDAWGSNGAAYPYLKAVATPWEQYEKYSNGAWTVERTPAELGERLRAKGYNMTGDITAVKVNGLCQNSPYVYSMTFVDSLGKAVTINTSDKLRITLGLNSANFVVGKAGQTVTVTDYTLQGYGETSPLENSLENGKVTVMTANGKASVSDPTKLKVATGSGTLAIGDAVNHIGELPDILSMPTVKTTHEITLTGKSGSYVFVGRGWGHGVGISQWGIHDLAELGYTYDVILKAYYSGAKLADYHQYR